MRNNYWKEHGSLHISVDKKEENSAKIHQQLHCFPKLYNSHLLAEKKTRSAVDYGNGGPRLENHPHWE